jgi:aldehyde dehydrogenase (NAD+)
MVPSNADVGKIIEQQHQFFRSGATRNIDFRIRQLAVLKQAIKSNENLILEALYQDLHKSQYEAFTTEIGIVYNDIGQIIKNVRRWAKPQKVKTPLSLLGAGSYVYPEPYGTVLIIGPYNYPMNLIFEPLMGVIAAANCAVIKPSEMSPHVSEVVAKIIKENFAEDFIRVVEGDKEVTEALINAPFDYIFFTGSARVGKIVLEAAAKNLIPVTLELGGKSPCIVDKTADINTAAKKIVWGKFSNAGQTCVAPDYLVVHQTVKKPLLEAITKYIECFYGKKPEDSPDYGRIINTAHTERLARLIDKAKVLTGGEYDIQQHYIAPTVLDKTSWDDEVMQDEIFGPLLPVIEYDDLAGVIEKINSKPKPLGLYLFSKDKTVEEKVISSISYGGGCLNEVLLHVGNSNLPFGGVGASGLGAYHGKTSFETFSHQKSILKRNFNINAMMSCPPYTSQQLNMVRKFLK